MSAIKDMSPADYAPDIKGIEFGEVHAEVREGLGESELLTALGRVAAMHRRSTWWLGDLLAHGDKIWDSYADAAKATGFAAGSLRNMASISRSVPPEIREASLPWRTHKVVATLERDDQRQWLAFALAKGMTSDEVERAIRGAGSDSSSGSEGLADPVSDAQICPNCHGRGTIEAKGKTS